MISKCRRRWSKPNSTRSGSSCSTKGRTRKIRRETAAALAEMESERDDYRKIAERRVRLGLLLSEIGQANGVEVSQQEMNRLIQQAAHKNSPKGPRPLGQKPQQGA